MPDNSKLSEEDNQLIVAAARRLMLDAVAMVNDKALLAVGALSMALGTAAAIARIPFGDLVTILGRQYENQLLEDVKNELKESNTADAVIAVRKDNGNN